MKTLILAVIIAVLATLDLSAQDTLKLEASIQAKGQVVLLSSSNALYFTYGGPNISFGYRGLEVATGFAPSLRVSYESGDKTRFSLGVFTKASHEKFLGGRLSIWGASFLARPSVQEKRWELAFGAGWRF